REAHLVSRKGDDMSSEIEIRADHDSEPEQGMDRRTFLRKGAIVGAATLLPAAGLVERANAQFNPNATGDIAILKFLAAAELIEEDLWQQYNELMGNTEYKEALETLDESFPRYISDV